MKKVFPDKEGLVRREEIILPNLTNYIRDVRVVGLSLMFVFVFQTPSLAVGDDSSVE